MNPRLLLGLFLLSALSCPAQPLSIDSAIADQHLTTRAEPCYPPIARAAHVSGQVVIEVTVGTDGKVDAAKLISGPPMLNFAALAAVKQYEYKPFEQDGHPVPAVTKVTVPFVLTQTDYGCTANNSAWKPYESLENKCLKALKSGQPQQQTDECKQALDAALLAPPANHRAQVSSAHRNYAEALFHAGSNQDALVELDADVANATRYLDPSEVQYTDAYLWRGTVEEALGDEQKAATNYSAAEFIFDNYGQLMKVNPRYRNQVVAALNEHASILEKAGHADVANALRSKATSYK